MRATGVLCALAALGCPAQGAVPADYWAERALLERQLRQQRPDANETLSPTEQALNASIVAEIAALRHKHFPPAAGHPASMPFRQVRDEIDATPLMALLHSMPKGALLHVHLLAMLDASWIVQNVTYRPYCHVQTLPPAQQPVPAADRVPQWTLHFQRHAANGSGWVPAAQLRAADPHFDDKLLALLDPLSSERRFVPSEDQWPPFQAYFKIVTPALNYRPVLRDYTRAAFRLAALEWRVHYLELRCCGSTERLYDLSGQRPRADLFHELQQASDDIAAELPGRFFGARLIYSENRQEDDISSALAEVTELRQSHPDLVVGFDLVDEEDRGHKLRWHVPRLLDASRKAAERNLTLPYFFHAGETDWYGPANTGDNAVDAAILAERVGHGLALAQLPAAAALLKSRGGCVEACPISNQALQYVLDLRTHPAASLLSQGVDVVLANDDPALLGTTRSLAYDWWEAMAGWAGMDLASAKSLARASIRHSRVDEGLRARIYAAWERDWSEWVGTSLARR
eukprot:TRINITY_DN4783_c1_g1_i2.p1 TRINITY_DN4783_c1_g1~~TRINITY_DN4783_c1_g1_i2.p1  ORF type:complete len:543 (+),score=134.34 TRINITY_DN4783_c1_g1_i2:86-1630(+)